MDPITRKCSICGKTKPVDDFYWKVRGKYRQPHCKECHKGYTHDYYKRKRADYARWSAERKKVNRAEAKRRLVAGERAVEAGEEVRALDRQLHRLDEEARTGIREQALDDGLVGLTDPVIGVEEDESHVFTAHRGRKCPA